VIFAVYFLGQSPERAKLRRTVPHEGFFRQVSLYSAIAWKASFGRLPTACVSRRLPSGDLEKDSQYGVTRLAEPIRSQTNLVNEAFSIAYHNGVILLDSSGDSAHRAFGCLYGVERYGGNPVAYVCERYSEAPVRHLHLLVRACRQEHAQGEVGSPALMLNPWLH
jgi:hypothetical protein